MVELDTIDDTLLNLLVKPRITEDKRVVALDKNMIVIGSVIALSAFVIGILMGALAIDNSSCPGTLHLGNQEMTSMLD